MWTNNKSVLRTYTTYHSQNSWAQISGISGYKKIKTGHKDGVTNVFALLCTAKANSRKVDVYVVNNVIERATMR